MYPRLNCLSGDFNSVHLTAKWQVYLVRFVTDQFDFLSLRKLKFGGKKYKTDQKGKKI